MGLRLYSAAHADNSFNAPLQSGCVGHNHNVHFSFVTIYVLIPFGAYFVGIIQFTTGKMPKVSHALSITEEAVTKSSPLATVTVPWSALHAVDQSKRTIFFFTNRSCAIMIPKSAFASQQAAQDFLSAAKAYWQQARV